jgi:hypothetical protein
MKRNTLRIKPAFKNSARENLPLLRGMFVSPRPAGSGKNSAGRNHAGMLDPVEGFDNAEGTHAMSLNNSGQCCLADDGLYLTAEEGYFLSRYE